MRNTKRKDKIAYHLSIADLLAAGLAMRAQEGSIDPADIEALRMALERLRRVVEQ